jgi:hypothetical protein
MIRPESRVAIDRKIVDTPKGTSLFAAVRGLTAPTSIAFVTEEGPYKGAMLVAENGGDGPLDTPRIFGWKQDGTFFNVYPHSSQFPTFGLFSSGNKIYGPIGGMVFTQGHIFVTHRDRDRRGVVSAVGFDGSVTTIQGGLPAQGDYSLTDIAVQPITGRLYFGLGAATNSGVVGIDNWQAGWVRNNPDFCDQPGVDIKLQGFKFLTKNPGAGLFGGDDNVETAPFQPFGHNNELRISGSPMPTAAIFSISPQGGDLRLVAYGIRNPRGLAFHPDAVVFLATNDGMELRGTRPVKEDPDVLVQIPPDGKNWYGWPDFSANFVSIDNERFLDRSLISRSGYPELTFLINHLASKLTSPEDTARQLLYGQFPWQSGAAKLDFVPSNSNLREYRGNVIVALDGDRAPFATSGQPLTMVTGRKIVRIDINEKRPEEFIHNTRNIPASKLGNDVEALERPNDVKFGPDGKLYILDYGRMEVKEGREKIVPGTGCIFVLEQTVPPSTAN